MGTILRQYVVYRPLRVFMPLALACGIIGAVLLARFGWYYLTEEGPTGHVQSLVVGSVATLAAIQLAMLGLVAELLRTNRLIAEKTLRRVRALELAARVEPEGLLQEVDPADLLRSEANRP